MATEPNAVGPHATPTPLPERIAPDSGECWVGYTERVAVFYQVSWQDLMAPVLPDPDANEISRANLRERCWLRAGLGVTYVSAKALGTYFRLAVPEVTRMHLTALEQSAIPTFSSGHAELDPFLTNPPGRQAWRLLTMVHRRRDQPGCARCLEDRPGHRRLTWRLRWHAICVDHRHPITSPGSPSVPVPDDAVTAQRQILARLTPAPINRAFFNALHQLTLSSFRADDKSSTSIQSVKPGALIPRLAALTADAARVADDQPSTITPRHTGARLLPLSLYTDDVAELSEPLDLDRGRRAALAGIRMRVHGLPPLCLGDHLKPELEDLHHLLEILQVTRRIDEYVQALDVAARAMLRTGHYPPPWGP